MSDESLQQAARRTLSVTLRVHEGRVGLASGSAELTTLQGRRCLVVQTAPVPSGSVAEAARLSEIRLRELSSESVLLPAGLGQGFRIEDLLLLELLLPPGSAAEAHSWWRRRLLPETELHEREADAFALRAVFAERGEVPTSQRKSYQREQALGDRVRVEAFELHVTEHCNLRCAHCCNTSPYLPEKTLSPESIASTLATMAGVLHADVFKIMGGEPLLHPRISEVLRVV